MFLQGAHSSRLDASVCHVHVCKGGTKFCIQETLINKSFALETDSLFDDEKTLLHVTSIGSKIQSSFIIMYVWAFDGYYHSAHADMEEDTN